MKRNNAPIANNSNVPETFTLDWLIKTAKEIFKDEKPHKPIHTIPCSSQTLAPSLENSGYKFDEKTKVWENEVGHTIKIANNRISCNVSSRPTKARPG